MTTSDPEQDRWAAFAHQHAGAYRDTRRPRYLPLRPVAGLGRATQILLLVQAVAAVALLFPAFDERSAINRALDDPGSVGLAEAQRLDDRLALVGLFGTLAYLATGIVFIVWFYRVRANAELWAEHLQRRSQGWAIGGWFCPVVNLWFPLMIAKDAVDSSQDGPEGYPMRRPRPLLAVWWTGVLAMWVSGLVVARMDPDAAEEFRSYADWVVVDTVITLIAIVPAVLMVRQLTDLQSRRIREQEQAFG